MSNKPTEKDKSLVKDEETEYYQRINVLMVDLGTDTALKLFKSLVPNGDVILFLKENSAKLKKNVSSDQYRRISNNTFVETDFDLAILIKLMLALFPQQLQQVHGSSRNPSLKTDLEQLKTIRNDLVGHRSAAKIKKEDFNDKWDTISLVLRRILPHNESREELDRRIKRYKTRPLDVSHVKKIMDELQELNSLVKQTRELGKEIQEFQLFFKRTPEQYVRYVKILLDGGKLVLLGVLNGEMKRNEVSFDTLEQENLDKLPENIKHIVLSSDPGSLDISVLGAVILNLFGNSINHEVKENIQIIMKARNGYADLAMLSLDQEKFFDTWTELIVSLKDLSLTLDLNSRTECSKMIKTYSKEKIDDTTAAEYLNQLENNGLDIMTLQEVYEDKLSELATRLVKFEDEDLPLQEELELHICVRCKNPDKITMVENNLQVEIVEALKTIHGSVANQQQSELHTLLQEIGNKSGVAITGVEKRCILLVLQIPTHRAMNFLINFVRSGHLERHIERVSRMLCLEYGEAISIQAKLTFESMKRLTDHMTQSRKRLLTQENVQDVLSKRTNEERGVEPQNEGMIKPKICVK